MDSILIVCAILKLYQQKKSDGDSRQRMQVCLKVLTGLGKQSISHMESLIAWNPPAGRRHCLESPSNFGSTIPHSEVDENIVFRQLKSGKEGKVLLGDFDITEEIDTEGYQEDSGNQSDLE